MAYVPPTQPLEGEQGEEGNRLREDEARDGVNKHLLLLNTPPTTSTSEAIAQRVASLNSNQ